MRSVAFLGLAAVGTADVPGSTKINDENLIAEYNSRNGATWVAGPNKFFDGMTFDDARPLLGTILTNNTVKVDAFVALGDVPSEFDARTQWPGLIHPIRNQEQCGSCWAFSASEVMSDRVAIASGIASPVLSPEDMVSCDESDNACKGGSLPNAWDYIENTGLLTDACFPYTAGSGQAPACETACVDGTAFIRTKAANVYPVTGVANVQTDLMTNGPIQVAYMVYKSFMSYQSGVYSKLSYETQAEGGHAVKLVGWGTDSGTDYWLVANSWSTEWGENGFFKIKRGSDECGIETMGPPYAGLPAAATTVVV